MVKSITKVIEFFKKICIIFDLRKKPKEMHFLVIINIEPNLIPTLTPKVLSCFSLYPYMSPVPNCYVIKVENQAVYNVILNNLQIIGKGKFGINILVTPLMSGGFYNGTLEPNTWNVLNNLTS